jgi:hypothetical protein
VISKTMILIVAATAATFAVDKFVTPDKLPSVPKQQRPAVEPSVEPEPTPIPQRCQCGCGKSNCTCGRKMSSCDSRIDEAALQSVMGHKLSASLKVPDEEVVLFAPTWCHHCPATEKRLDGGDQNTRIVVKHEDAHFPVPLYPCFWNPKTTRYWCGVPKDMDELRRHLRMEPPVTKYPELGAITVYTFTKEEGDWLKDIFGESGPINLPNKERVVDLGHGASLKIPKRFSGDNKIADGVTHATFKTPLEMKWGVLNQTCTGLTIKGNVVTWELPWAPDAVTPIDETEGDDQ